MLALKLGLKSFNKTQNKLYKTGTIQSYQLAVVYVIKAISLSTIFDQLNLILIFFIIKNSNEILTIKENISFEN